MDEFHAAKDSVRFFFCWMPPSTITNTARSLRLVGNEEQKKTMLTFSSKRLAAVLAVIVARQGVQGFVPRPPARFGGTCFFSTASDEVASMRASEIKKELESYGISTKSFLEKSELVDALTKARADGLKPKETTTTSATSSSAASSSSTSSASREERLKKELEICKAMKASELKKELQGFGVSTKSFFEKSEFAQALAEARVDGVKKAAAAVDTGEGYAEYTNVEVLTDDSAGPRQKQSQQRQSGGGSPFSGGASPFGGGSPFGGMGGMGDMMGGMGGIADMLKNFGASGASPGANPFAGGGGSPFGGGVGGMGDMMGKAQEMMKNPKIQEIIAKAQSNPKVMAAVSECMSNPAAFAKYQSDPEISGLLTELRKYM